MVEVHHRLQGSQLNLTLHQVQQGEVNLHLVTLILLLVEVMEVQLVLLQGVLDRVGMVVTELDMVQVRVDSQLLLDTIGQQQRVVVVVVVAGLGQKAHYFQIHHMVICQSLF